MGFFKKDDTKAKKAESAAESTKEKEAVTDIFGNEVKEEKLPEVKIPGKAGKKPVKKKKTTIPKTVQQTLCWEEVYDNGVFRIGPKEFSKTFEFNDVSFRTKSDEDQEAIYESYMRFLNLLSDEEDLFITFVNYAEDEKEKLSRVLPPSKGDGLDVYRQELTSILKQNIAISRSNISTRRFVTVCINSDSVDDAMKRLAVLGGELESNFKRIAGSSLRPLSLAERLELMHIILNGQEPNYWFIHDKSGNVSVDFERMARTGQTTKDIVAPVSMKFTGNKIEIGERMAQSMYLDGLANLMDSNFLSSLTSVNFESVFTMHINVLNQIEAIKKIKNQSLNITAEIQAKQKKSMEKGFNPEFINTDLQNAKKQVELLRDDITNRDQRLFFMSMAIAHFAPDEETLREQSKIIKDLAGKYMCDMKPCSMMQERGFSSALPLGHDKLYGNKLLTTEALGVFLPFDEVNQFDKNGTYYGTNAINKTLIIYNRKKGQNYNGLIFGMSGSGKSFSAKREMVSAILQGNEDIYIIDPDGEYTPLADMLGGTIIKIAPGNKVYINPFDLDIDNSFDRDLNPITMKIDFICGMVETMMGNNMKLNPIQRTVLDRCIQQVYKPYLEHLAELAPDKNGRRRTIDRSACPTMTNLFDMLLSQQEPEAQQLALVMETYTTGTFDTFAHRTNVDVDNDLIIYDIKNIGENLKELGLKVCMNEVWNKMVENRKREKWTRLYVDEFHLFFKSEATAEFLKTVWKRARKFQGMPTGITQNIGDLLNNNASAAIFDNTAFVYMLNQSYTDAQILKELLRLSDGDLEYMINVEPGHGVIHISNQSIPFEDKFPENTKLFEIMTTKAKEE